MLLYYDDPKLNITHYPQENKNKIWIQHMLHTY